jgi:hypothetical protein
MFKNLWFLRLQGMLMSEPSEKLDSFSLLAYMSPLAMLWLIPTTMLLEPDSPTIVQELLLKNTGFVFLVSLSCALAFFANLLNFLITKHTSALTLQVCLSNHSCTPLIQLLLLLCILPGAGTAAAVAGNDHRPQSLYLHIPQNILF